CLFSLCELQFPRGATVSSLNHQRRRSRTFRVELLESRALLSAAGLVSRPATAVASMARIAAFSSTATPEFSTDPTGSFKGKVHPHSTGISIKTTGVFDGVADTVFHGAAKYTQGATPDKIHFVKGKAVLVTPNKHTDLTIKFTGSGSVHDG